MSVIVDNLYKRYKIKNYKNKSVKGTNNTVGLVCKTLLISLGYIFIFYFHLLHSEIFVLIMLLIMDFLIIFF